DRAAGGAAVAPQHLESHAGGPPGGLHPGNEQVIPPMKHSDAYPEHAGAVRLYGPEAVEDPAAFFEELRRKHGPVVPVLLDADLPAWLVLGYRELHHVTGEARLFGRDPRRWNLLDYMPPDWPSLPYVLYQPSLVCSEGEERSRRAGAIGDALDGID